MLACVGVKVQYRAKWDVRCTGNQPVTCKRHHGKLRDALEVVEREMIHEGLQRTNWNKTRLAKELGISRANLIMKVQKYGFTRPNKES